MSPKNCSRLAGESTQEEAEKQEHPLNRIISIDKDAQGVMINTTDIHLPHRIG